MKRKIIAFVAAGFCVLVLQAQTVDSLSLKAKYANQSFYSMSNGEVTNVDNTNWDLAFDVSNRGSTIRTNGQAGIKLYLYTKGDTSAWNSLDTSGISGWPVLYNTDTSWENGAFNRGGGTGWGAYNPITHMVTGDSLFVIKLSNGAWKKFWCKKLGGGVYTFRYANLDGSVDTTVQLSKAGYSGKNFAYYSLRDGKALDREPAGEKWDLTFTRYVGEIAPHKFYGVTGALSNKKVSVAEAGGVDVNGVNYKDYTYRSDISVIGYDWKTFDRKTYQYKVGDSLVYFVNDRSGSVWKLIFKDFEGSKTGKIVFSKQKVFSAGTEDHQSTVKFLRVYPNPASGFVQVLYNHKNTSDAALDIYNLAGRKVFHKKISTDRPGINRQRISFQLSGGMYIIRIKAGSEIARQKLIISE